MFNLMKFEMLKRKKMFSILGVLFLIMQAFIIYETSITSTIDIDIMGKGFLLIFISYTVFIFSSILTFSKDINSTDRSLVFMTPYSGFTIISSKFLATFILGLCLLLVTSILSFANIYYIAPQNGIEFINYLQDNLSVIGELILGIATLSSFFALVFLSIIITKTFLSKLKFKTFIVVIIMSILSKFFNLMFWDNLNKFSSVSVGMSIVTIVCITTLMLWISGWLIDNKTDF